MKKSARNILVIIAMAGMAAALFLPSYLRSITDELSLPLASGTVWKYQGEYVSSGGQKEIKMKAPEHRIVIERVTEMEGEKRYLLAFFNGDHRWQAFILAQDAKGLFMVQGRNHRIMVFPRKIFLGQKWNVNTGVDRFLGQAWGKKKFSSPIGELTGREVSFSNREGIRLKLWINPRMGITAIHYSYLGEGANRNTANLVLSSMEKTSSR
jgi:hypothetical protein